MLINKLFLAHISSVLVIVRLKTVRSNVLSTKCPFDLGFVGHLPFGHLSFGLLSFRLNVFWPHVLSVICLSAMCPFGDLSFGHLFFHTTDHAARGMFLPIMS